MQIGSVTIPDTCPEACPGLDEQEFSGGLCKKCPVFNVPEVVSASEYREDWAKEYLKLFNTGELPVLSIEEESHSLDHWSKYTGYRMKTMYDIKTKSGDVYPCYWPNGGSWTPCNCHATPSFDDDDIDMVKLSGVHMATHEKEEFVEYWNKLKEEPGESCSSEP